MLTMSIKKYTYIFQSWMQGLTNWMFAGVGGEHFLEVIAAHGQDKLVGWQQLPFTCQGHVNHRLL